MTIIHKILPKEKTPVLDQCLQEILQDSPIKSIEALLELMSDKEQWSLEDLFIIVYCLVSEFFDNIGGQKSLRRSNNNAPEFTDAEVVTIELVGQLALLDSQRAWYRFVKKNYHHLFPRLCCRSQYSRRVARLHKIISRFGKNLCALLDASYSQAFLIDSFPLQLCNIQRLKSSSQPFELFGADIGYCAAKKLHYYGYKCHLVTDLRGVPVFICLTSAHMSDLKAFEFVITQMLQEKAIKGATVFIGDKGYIGEKFQCYIQGNYGVELLSMEREYSKYTEKYGPSCRNEFLKKVRKIIETTIDLFSVEFTAGRTRRRSLSGLLSSLTSKIAAFNLGNFLNLLLGQPLLHVKGFIY